VGDILEWLKAHANLSGVTRVVVELFYGALDIPRDVSLMILPCVLEPSTNLAAVPVTELLAYFATRTGKPVRPTDTLSRISWTDAVPSPGPKDGDYVLFAGVVWTPQYIKLFHRLSFLGARICILVHDIIPIERPDLVSDYSRRTFADWLRFVVSNAKIVFVSSVMIKDQILRWGALAGVDVSTDIVPITFGRTELGPLLPAQALRQNPKTNAVDMDAFVLSVGTIDRRKNQSMLSKVWVDLILELGKHQVPQLVLAGRNDLNSHDWDLNCKGAFERSEILILDTLSDSELGTLYHSCLFTVFPSLSEGYGLPVAESLACGKLCIASKLGTIKEHAGDLAWYFDPNAEAAARDCIRLAIHRPDLRMASEARIKQLYKPTSWTHTFYSVAEAMNADNTKSDLV